MDIDVVQEYKRSLKENGEEEKLKIENIEFQKLLDKVMASDKTLPIQAIYYWVEAKGENVFDFPHEAEEWRKDHSSIYMVRACEIASGLDLPENSPDREVALEYRRKLQQSKMNLEKIAITQLEKYKKPKKKWWQFWIKTD